MLTKYEEYKVLYCYIKLTSIEYSQNNIILYINIVFLLIFAISSHLNLLIIKKQVKNYEIMKNIEIKT